MYGVQKNTTVVLLAVARMADCAVDCDGLRGPLLLEIEEAEDVDWMLVLE